MDFFSLIIGFVWGGLACWWWLSSQLDALDSKIAETKTAQSIAEHKLKRTNTKLADIHQMSAPD